MEMVEKLGIRERQKYRRGTHFVVLPHNKKCEQSAGILPGLFRLLDPSLTR
jgi:hypothetical protein